MLEQKKDDGVVLTSYLHREQSPQENNSQTPVSEPLMGHGSTGTDNTGVVEMQNIVPELDRTCHTMILPKLSWELDGKLLLTTLTCIRESEI